MILNLNIGKEEYINLLLKCCADGTTPEEVVQGFINDLVDGSCSNGSDERGLAAEYYDRCGYSDNWVPFDQCTFVQWILREFSKFTLKEIYDSLDDIETFKEEIDYLNMYPEQCRPGEIEELQDEIKDSEESIEWYYNKYVHATIDPETFAQGLEGVRNFVKMLEDIK